MKLSGALAGRLAQHLEAPTWILACTIYGGWLALTWYWNALPLWAALPAGAWLSAWHMSLQHELIHGHPTRSERINAALAMPPLNLWLPFPLYREAHRRHHRDAHLTDPLEDPESTYVSFQEWNRAGTLRRWLRRACMTAIGRILLGPPRAVLQFWQQQAWQLLAGKARRDIWLSHAAYLCLVIGWLRLVCHVDLLAYLACFVYPGTALTMLRSLAEHRAAEHPTDRTAVVERAGLLGLLFLNNNLHLLHHAQPSLPWYGLPGQWRRLRADLLRRGQTPLYDGYRDVLRRHALRPLHAGWHPSAGRDGNDQAGTKTAWGHAK